MPANTRERIVEATAILMRRNGYTGTGLKQIAGASGAPFGSVYHFFPGGKEELTAAALRSAGQAYQQLVEGVIDAADDLVAGIHDAFAGAAAVLEATDYADACPIETVALEVASTNDRLRLVTAEVFESWITGATTRGEAVGLAPQQARRLAIGFIAALEGAFVLARAAKDVEPLLAAGDMVVVALRQALTDAGRRGG
jgi:AcrR family transcriptional regulator